MVGCTSWDGVQQRRAALPAGRRFDARDSGISRDIQIKLLYSRGFAQAFGSALGLLTLLLHILAVRSISLVAPWMLLGRRGRAFCHGGTNCQCMLGSRERLVWSSQA